ncbi:transposase [Escherichia coli]|nr:transposase [Escherichia coli]
MIYIEQLELIHKSGDVLYPVKITRKSSGKTAFHLVPFGLNKTHDLLEVEDASEAIRLVIDERHSIRCSTLTATITNKKGKRIKRTGIYSIKGVKEGANKQVISSQADSLIKISRIWADFFPVNTSNQPI